MSARAGRALAGRMRMTIHAGENDIGGVPVLAVRARAKRMIVRVKPDGSVRLTVPLWRATLAQAAEFLESKWSWVLAARARALANPPPPERAVSPEEAMELRALLDALHREWSARLGEPDVPWKLRRMKTRWGVCNISRRAVTYAAMLAGRPRALVEYVVVHELTHLKAAGHGPRFQALMDARLPDWRARRRALNRGG